MTALNPTLLWEPDQLPDGFAHLGGHFRGTSRPAAEATIAATMAAVLGEPPIGLTSESEHLAACIADCAPMVLKVVLKVQNAEAALLVVRASRRRAVLLGRDGLHHHLPMIELAAVLETPLPDELQATIEHLGSALATPDSELADAFRREHRKHRPLFVGWKLPVSGPQTLGKVLRAAPVILRGSALAAVHVVHFSLWIVSWLALVSALLGVGDRAPLLALWVVALTTSMLALVVESTLQHSLATRVGVAMRQHLLRAALAMNESVVRAQGIGALVARALEANNLDALASKGGIKVLLTTFDFLIVAVAFYLFAGLHALLLLFVATLVATVVLCGSYYRAEERLHSTNLSVTGLHTEEMIGHRTRKAFLGRSAWHSEEDAVLAAYEQASAVTDRAAVLLGSVPRLWAALGVSVVLAELFIQGAGTSTLTSVGMIGFVIVGLSTLQNVAAGIMQLIKALISLNYLGALEQNFHGDLASRNPNAPRTSAAPSARPANPQLLVKSLRYTYPGAARPVVRDASLSLPAGRKLLLSGTSGSGKSTFGALLAGRLEPDAGAVLSDGVDRHIVGASDWHRYICYVPQFSNNHVLTDTFAFNLLLGRSWPPSQDDLRAAREVAVRLGLGELVEKMPAGMMQMVGEGGWHLSQGERSRLFVARGILQQANVLIADELLSPLDPDTGLNVMKTLEALDSQLILIAHT